MIKFKFRPIKIVHHWGFLSGLKSILARSLNFLGYIEVLRTKLFCGELGMEGSRTYKIEKRITIFLESNEAARLYFLHLLLGVS